MGPACKISGLSLVLLALLTFAGYSKAARDLLQDVQDVQTSHIDQMYSAENFTALCKAWGPFLPLLGVKPDDLCLTTGFSWNTAQCGILKLIEGGIMGIEHNGTVCHGDLQSPAATTSRQGKTLPYPLTDKRPLSLSLLPNVLVKEGASYYFLYRTLLNFELAAGCAATDEIRNVTTGAPSSDWLVPTNWTVDSTIWQADGHLAPGPGLYWPFATVMYKGDSVVVLIRGTATEIDWRDDFSYNLTEGKNVPGMNLPGKVHSGFARIASSLWLGIKAALTKLVVQKSTGVSVTNVYVAGHSLGGGVATLVSYAAQEYVKTVTPQVKVDALLIGSPNAGDKTFASKFGTVVNGRSITFPNDVIPQVPCKPAMIGCKQTPVPTPTTNPHGLQLWQYSSVPGSLSIAPSKMPQQAFQWSLFDLIYPCQALRFIEATHICSYTCYLSQFVDDANNLCKLWSNVPSSAPGSYCFAYPATDGPWKEYPYVHL